MSKGNYRKIVRKFIQEKLNAGVRVLELVCLFVCACVCMQVCTMYFKSGNYRLPTFVNVRARRCVCVRGIVEPIFSFPTSFSAYVPACIAIAPGLFLCAQVRARERMCARLAIPISLMLVFAFRLYLVNITSFNDF